MKFEEYEELVVQWANEKGILPGAHPYTQLLKCMSEIGEVADCEAKGQTDMRLWLEVGDVLVTLLIYAKLRNVSLSECLGLAYLKIRDRKGLTVNGVFIKE
jgi:NTP pyrophosphatase (non-canonical NTP hydrolase)